MRFYHKIIFLALCIAFLAAGASVLPKLLNADLTDPAYWKAVGHQMVGLSENGWCKCS